MKKFFGNVINFIRSNKFTENSFTNVSINPNICKTPQISRNLYNKHNNEYCFVINGLLKFLMSSKGNE